jgi:hypothetical protein
MLLWLLERFVSSALYMQPAPEVGPAATQNDHVKETAFSSGMMFNCSQLTVQPLACVKR